MKILLAMHLPYAPARSGAARCNRALLEALAARGHEVTAVVRGTLTSTERVSIERSKGVDVHAVNDPGEIRSYLAAQLARLDPDAVLVSGEDPSHNLLAPALRSRPERVVYLVHAASTLPLGPHSFFPSEHAAQRVARVGAVVTPSEATARYVRAHSGLDPTVLAYPAYGTPPFPDLHRFDRGAVTLINPSAIKGIAIFVALARALPSVEFAAVPSWATTPDDLRAMQQLPNVRVLSPTDDIDRFYRETRVLLVPSLWHETFGMVVVEAMLRGIPVVASDVGGLPEAKLGTGFVVPVAPIERYDDRLDAALLPVAVVPDQDLRPWVAAIRQLLDDRAAYEAESEASRRAALAFVSNLHVEKWEALLEGVARPRAPARSHRARPSVKSATDGPSLGIVVAATFTADPIEESLAFWLDALGLRHDVAFAPYAQLFQSLLDPSSVLAANRLGVNVLLVRLSDFPEAERERTATELAAAIRARAADGSRYVLVLCPVSEEHERATCVAAAASLADALRDATAVHVVTSEQLAASYPVADVFDPRADAIGHVPYTRAFFAALGTAVARRVHALVTPPYKAIVVDADGTLWSGVCAEDGPRGVRIDDARRAFHLLLAAQRRAGALLCMCSKNDERDVFETFDARRDDMGVRREDFTAWRIGWQPKSEAVRELAAELGLGLDAFVVVDDSPLECAEIRAAHPEALVIELPQHSDDGIATLAHTWAFDRVANTEEDRQRGAYYEANARRLAAMRKAPSLDEFLEQLQIEVVIAPLAEPDLARAAQLTQRTNQFNCRPVRRSEPELRALLGGATRGLVATVRDRFGDYGMVGLVLFEARPHAVRVDTFLLSCRALGRRVEHRMLAALGEIAIEQQLELVDVPFVATHRNRPARDFLESFVEGTAPSDGDVGVVYRIPAALAAAAPARRKLARAPSAAPVAHEAASASLRADAVRRADVLQRAAGELREAQAVVRAIDGARATTSGSNGAPARVPPRNEIETRLVSIWEAILGCPVGVTDDFFDLGGHSLIALRMFREIETAFQCRLPLRFLFEATTVEQMAAALEASPTADDAPPPHTSVRPAPSREPKRVMMLTTEFPPDVVGGLGTHVKELAAGLAALDVTVDVVVALPILWGAPVGRSIEQARLRVHVAPAETLSRNGDVLACAREVVRSFGAPDVIHVHDRFYFPAAVELREELRVPIVSTVHVPLKAVSAWAGEQQPEGHEDLEERLCRDSDAVIAVSSSVREILEEMYQVAPARVHVVHNGFDAAAFLEPAAGADDGAALRRELGIGQHRVVLFAGRMARMKGIDALIASAADVIAQHPDVRYLVAGALMPDYVEELDRLRSRHPDVAKQFVILGKVPRARLARLYRLADVAVVPSAYEPFGYAAVEAMASGVPVVAARAGGLAEIIRHRQTGLLAPVRTLADGHRQVDPVELAALQNEILSDAAWASSLAAAARTDVVERFAVGPMARATLELYRRLATV